MLWENPLPGYARFFRQWWEWRERWQSLRGTILEMVKFKGLEYLLMQVIPTS